MTDPALALHHLELAEASITYTNQGDGEPVLLLHAGVFAAWFPALSAHPDMSGFRLITTVRAGYDTTRPAPTRHLTLADHARHCVTLLDTLEIEKTHVLGHSAGSLIGLQLAADHPQRVHSLVLVEPAAAPSLLPPDVAAGFSSAVDAMTATAARDPGRAFDEFMRVVCAEDYREVLHAVLSADGLHRAERDCGFFFRDEIPAVHEWVFSPTAARRIIQPALFVQGAASSPILHGVATRLAEALPNAQTTTVEGDHLLPLRHPSTLAAVAAAFLNRHPVAAATPTAVP
jgi:pimeloyl-ACP methyl ester carboxylesterase